MAHFLIPTNPCAKRTKGLEAITKLERVASGYPHHEVTFVDIPIAESGAPEDIVYAYMRAMAPYLGQGNIDAILGNTGDSGHLYIDSALGRLGSLHIPQANLRAGTINVRGENANFEHRSIYNRTIGPETTYCHTLRIMLNAYAEGESLRTVPRRLLKIKTKKGTYHGFCLGGGFVTNYFARYEAAGATHPAAIKEILKAAAQTGASLLPGVNLIEDLTRPCKAKIQIGDRTLDAEEHLGFMLTGLDIVMDFGPLELGVHNLIGTNDRPDFRIAYCEQGSLVELAKNLPRVLGVKHHFTPKPLGHLDLLTLDTKLVKIQPIEPVLAIVDGELMIFEDEIKIEPSVEVPYLII
jgi:hypothetical protein